MIHPHLAARLFDQPLMIDARKAAAILAVLGPRFSAGGFSVETPIDAVDHVAFANGRPSMGRLGDQLGRLYDRANVLPFDIVDSVAVIPIEGTLVHKGGFVGASSGRTSYQGLQAQVRRAASSDAVKGVVFEVDSFGGEVAGAFETADMIAELSAAKPTIAILTDFALSAGYLLASAARQIVMPEFGRAGSIGVITLHADYSRHLEQEGIKVTILAAGKHKADGNPFQALPDALAAKIRANVEQGRQAFAAHVGRYRGNRFTAVQALETEAQDFRASEAIDLGMVDGVGKANDLFSAFIAAVNRK